MKNKACRCIICKKYAEAFFMNIIIINRWQDDFADYQGVVDHKLNDVVYITNNSGSKYLDSVVVPYEH